MRIEMIGIDHRTTPLEQRERVAVSAAQLATTRATLKTDAPGVECVLLSTCNRTELYLAGPSHTKPPIESAESWFMRQLGVAAEQFNQHKVRRSQLDAVRHLVRVCVGLESMIPGEREIVGQVRRAYESADAGGDVGPTLHRCFQHALRASKRIRTESGIDAGRTSLGSIGVEFAQQIFASFTDKYVLLIGAGEIAKAILPYWIKVEPKTLTLINRGAERAGALERSFDADFDYRPWEALDDALVEADIVLTTTGAIEPVITDARFKPLHRRRRHRPLLILDLAVPRDVSAEVAAYRDVYLYTLDDLRGVIDRNLEQRRGVITRCEQMAHDAAERCVEKLRRQEIGRLVRQLRHRMQEAGEAEQQRTLRKLIAGPDADPDTLAGLLDEHTHRLINKLLHAPLERLHDPDPDTPVGFYATALRELFGLDEPADVEDEASDDPARSVDPEVPPTRRSSIAR